MMLRLILFAVFTITATIHPQHAEAQVEEEVIEEDESTEEAIDLSKLVATSQVKAYCSNRLLGQSVTKLVTLGYDFQGVHEISSPAGNQSISQLANVQTLRFAVNYPVYSRNTALLNLGFEYQDTKYSFSENGNLAHPFHQALREEGLSRIGIVPTLFKPLNSRNWLLIQASVFIFSNDPTESIKAGKLRYQAAAIYGWKVSDYKMWGIGASRTYIGGALNYLPVLYYRYSAQNGKWGIETVLPSKAFYRRTLNPKNVLNLGFYTEGGSFNLSNKTYDSQLGEGQQILPGVGYNEPELRRAELRLNVSYDRALTKLFWISIEGGYRYNWSFDLDDGDFVRGFFSDKDYALTNDLSNPLFFQISLSFVSP